MMKRTGDPEVEGKGKEMGPSRHCGVTYSTGCLRLHARKDRCREKKKMHSWPGGRLQSSSAQVKTLQECVKEWGAGGSAQD